MARRWFTEPGALLMSATTASQLALKAGAPFELEVAGVRRAARLTGTAQAPAGGLDSLLLTDIAQAQEWLAANGRLSRIDARAPPGAAAASWVRQLQARLPPPLELRSTRAGARETLDMTSAFTSNLQATSGNVSESARLAKRNRTDFYKLLARHRVAPEDFKKDDAKE